jgi:hypothetical protein
MKVTAMKKIALIAATLTASAFSPSAAQNNSSVLPSLPPAVQKHIEDVRAGCRETLKGLDEDTTDIPSGDARVAFGEDSWFVGTIDRPRIETG